MVGRVISGFKLTGCRMHQTITRLSKMREDEYSMFLRTLFGFTGPSIVEEVKVGEGGIEWITEGLNESQKEAICFALGSKEVALIHGPPGVSLLHSLTKLFNALMLFDFLLLTSN